MPPPTKAGQAVWVVVDEKEVFVMDVNLMVGEDIHHEEDEHPLVVEDMHHVQDVHLIVGVGGKDDEQLGGCVVGVDLSVDVDGVRHPVKRGGEVLGAKVLINERSLRRKSEDDVLDERRLVEGLVLDAYRDILSFTTLWLHELKGVRVSGQGDPPGSGLG